MNRDHEPDQLSFFDVGVDVKKLRGEAARIICQSSHSASTRRAYASDWRDFESWCVAAGRRSLPATPDTLQLYLVDRLAVHKLATVERRLAAIVSMHERDDLASPFSRDVKALLKGVRRERGSKQVQKAALTVDALKKICVRLASSPGEAAARDRAIIALGFSAALRRSELVSLNVDDLRFEKNKGLAVTIRKSKTDQGGHGRVAGVFKASRPAYCPVSSVRDWLRIGKLKSGPLFPGTGTTNRLSEAGVGLIVKRCVASIGLDPKLYGAHSLRAGFVTAAALAGVPESVIMQRTGHRSVQTVTRYVRPASVFAVDALARAL
jgi:integrase